MTLSDLGNLSSIIYPVESYNYNRWKFHSRDVCTGLIVQGRPRSFITSSNVIETVHERHMQTHDVVGDLA